jgi:uncharacterized repeat protein (TIGR02543 family)
MIRQTEFYVWARVLLPAVVIAAVLSSAAVPAQTANVEAKAYKYQLVDVPGTMMSQPFLAGIRVDDAETEFIVYLDADGNVVKIPGTIEHGEYKSSSANPMTSGRVSSVIKALTQHWSPVTTEVGIPCKVTFNSNYEKQADRVASLSSGDLIVGPALTRFGYSFKGYFYDKAGTRPVKDDAVAKGDVTVYAGWEKWSDETLHYMNMYRSMEEKAQYIMERAPAYEEKSFTKLYELAFMAFLRVEAAGTLVDSNSIGMVTAATGALNEVIQVADPEKISWYIWGSQMPAEAGADKFEYYGHLDNEKWRPFLVPYMLKDQTKVKGNIVIVAGGGYFLRSNIEESYSTAKVMNALGYNCFVLQRRVSPYAPIDSAIDLQRAIRFLKYHASEYGIAKTENIATAGFSGGGGTITRQAEKFFGAVSPKSYDPNYMEDAIDKLDSDVKAMLVIYSAGNLKDNDNPHYPATFIGFGSLDPLSHAVPDYYLALQAKGVFTEIHGFAGAPHGFGAGTGIPDYAGTSPVGFGAATDRNATHYGSGKPYLLAYTGAQQWTRLADTFLDQVFGYKPVSY